MPDNTLPDVRAPRQFLKPEELTLAQRVRAKFPGSYEQMSDIELETAIRSKFPGSYDHVPSTAPPPKPEPGMIGTGPGGAGVVPDPQGYVREQAQAHEENLPQYAAGAAGAMTGGLGYAPAMAIVGGSAAGGKAVQHGLRGESPINPDVVTTGLTEGVMEGAGRAVGGGLKWAGDKLYRGALDVAPALRKQFAKLDIPAIGLKERSLVSDAGAAKRAAITTASTEAAKTAIGAADDAGVAGGTLREVRKGLGPAYRQVAKGRRAGEAGAERARTALDERAKRLAEEYGVVKPAEPPTPERVVRVARRGAPPTDPGTGVEAVQRAEYQLGPQAELAPSSVFQPTANEVRAQRQLGSTAGTIPPRILNGPLEAPAVTEFVTPGRPGSPAEYGTKPLRWLDKQKDYLAQQAREALQAKGAGALIDDPQTIANLGMRGQHQRAIEKRVPDISGLNKRTQELFALELAQEAAAHARRESKKLLPPGGMTMWGQTAGLLSTPQAKSGMGIAANELAPLALDSPQLARLIEMLSRGETVDQLKGQQP